MPLTRSVSRGSSGSGRTRKSLEEVFIVLQFYHMQAVKHRKARTLPGFPCDLAYAHIVLGRPTGARRRENTLSLTVQSSEQPDQENDRQRNANKPKQKAASHRVPPLK